MKKKLLTAVSLLLFSFASFTALQAQEPSRITLGIIAAPLANVHEEPVPKSPLATQVLMGDEVRILDKRDNRYRVRIPDQGSREGWVQQEAVVLPKDGGRHYLSPDRAWIVIAVPKTEALILDRTGNHKVPLYGGTRLPVIEKTSDGYKVQFPDRSVAVIDTADAMPVKTADPVLNPTRAEEIANTAKRFRGVRYLQGGMTTQGIDINGLIEVTYRIHGFPLGRGVSALRTQAEQVSKQDLEAGDILVFYGEQEGLYLGGGQFLQTARKGTVQTAGIHDARFARSLQYGLRIIDAGLNEHKRPVDMSADEILLAQSRTAGMPLGKRIAYWAGRFIGTPYDPDPLGLYVRSNRIVADEKVDCMYHAFRSVELAETGTPGEAVAKALDLRFLTQGKIADGIVTNYDDRFQYGEDMVMSGKWGRNITADLGAASTIPGSRGRETVDVLPKNVLLTRSLQKKLQDGDIVFWVKDPKKRVVEEIVAHLSVVHIKSGKPYVIHAAGDKDQPGRAGGGVVKEVPFADYVRNMKFIGAFVTRFEQADAKTQEAGSK